METFGPTWEIASRLADFLNGTGPWRVALVALAFVLGALVLAPRPLLCVVSGLVFGAWGFPLALLSATLGASFAFWVGRRYLRSWLLGWAGRHATACAILNAIEQEGFRAVLLLRLGPIVPSSLQSYLFAATAVPFRSYLLATCLGITPGVAAQVALGTAGRIALQAELRVSHLVLGAAGSLALLVATSLIGIRARRILRNGSQACRSTVG